MIYYNALCTGEGVALLLILLLFLFAVSKYRVNTLEKLISRVMDAGVYVYLCKVKGPIFLYQ